MSDLILVVGHNSDWKKIYRLGTMHVGEVNRLDELHYVAAGKGANTARALEGYDGERFLRVVPPAIETVNPIGSGDAASGGIAMSFVRGEDLGAALRRGAAMGTANCLTLKTGQVDPDRVGRLLGELAVEEL